MKKHRSRIKLLIDILDTIYEDNETNLSLISLKANIPYTRLKPIIDKLHKNGLILMKRKDKKTTEISLTEKGLKMFIELKSFYKILNQLGLD